MRIKEILLLLLAALASACSGEKAYEKADPAGKLFIIGGGERPADMVNEMIRLSGTDTAGYIVVLPMASSEPDTSGWYGKKQFTEQGVQNVVVLNTRGTSGPLKLKILR